MAYADTTFQLGDLLLDGERYIVERVRGTAAISGRRPAGRRVAYLHGEWDDGDDPYAEPKDLELLISVHAFDEYGARTGTPYSHLRENFEDLAFEIEARGKLDVRQHLADGTEIQNAARVYSQTEIQGDPLVWYMTVGLRFPYPWWHELPQISRASSTAHAITTAGSAPIADPVFTFAGDGTLTDDLGLGHEITISGSSGAVVVDVGAREVTQGGVLAMSLLELGEDSPEHWLEWPARTSLNVSSTVGVAIDYYNARA